jgi:integrase
MTLNAFPKATGRTRQIRVTASVIEREIRAARSRGERTVLLDQACPGLRLVIGSRTASWTVTARARGVDLDGKRHPLRTHVIGDAVDLDPDSARTAAAAVKRAVATGADPTAERKERERQAALSRRAAADGAVARRIMLERALQPLPTDTRKSISIIDFSALADASLKECAVAFGIHGARGKSAHVDDTVRHILRGLDEMHVSDLRPEELRQAKVRALADLHLKAGRPATARHRLGGLNRLYKWLVGVDAVATNPVASVQQPAPPQPRANVLSAETVKLLWDGAERLSAPRRNYLRLALLLPLRRQELADLTVRDVVVVDGNVSELRLDGIKVKNGRTFIMPLVGTASAIVQQLVDRARSPNDHLLPLTRSGAPFSAWKRFHQQIEMETGIRLAWHDLRRTFASEMGEHAAATFAVVDGLLNHAASGTRSGAAKSYHHGVERRPKTEAMAVWDRIVADAVAHGVWPRQAASGGNVVPLTLNMIV